MMYILCICGKNDGNFLSLFGPCWSNDPYDMCCRIRSLKPAADNPPSLLLLLLPPPPPPLPIRPLPPQSTTTYTVVLPAQLPPSDDDPQTQKRQATKRQQSTFPPILFLFPPPHPFSAPFRARPARGPALFHDPGRRAGCLCFVEEDE